MVAMTCTRRSDEQLACMLYDTANWIMNGDQGVVLCEVASLQLAIEKAVEFTFLGREVVALMRRRSPEIVVLSDQIRKLTNCPRQSLGLTGPHVAGPVNEIAEGGVPSILIATHVVTFEAAA
jgi:hypothetical protein